jgi:aminopeptidase N
LACVPGLASRITRGQLQLIALLLTAATPSAAVGQTGRTNPTVAAVAPGIAKTLARHRAAAIHDVSYDLTLDVTALDSAVGRVTVRFRRSDSGDAIIDFRGRRLTSSVANGQDIPASAATNGHIRIPARLLKPGENALDFAFVADIAPSAASIIRSHDPTDGSDYLYTLLVPADANQLFPSFDQPDLKARVRLTLTAPAAWAVVANGSIESADTTGDRVTTRFAETRVCSAQTQTRASPRSGSSRHLGVRPAGARVARAGAPRGASEGASETGAEPVEWNSPGEAPGSGGRALQRPAGAPALARAGPLARAPTALQRPVGASGLARARSLARAPACEPAPISTYLIAFAAGPWTRASSTRTHRTINVYVRRSRAAEADLDTLLALNHRALEWMERYFGRPYPFEKFDFVLAPAFPFGGMEHPGAVFYNEDRFIFRERPTLPQRLNRFATILHEVAHQWFGDLVTMRWFDDLWLKEGFATFMASKALADIDPGADAWKTFYLSNKPPAYAVDQTAGTRPLWQELANLDQAKSNYGAIVYNKAPSVLKQLDYLVGDSAFQVGVQRFLNQHAYGNATWQDLLGAIGHAAHRPLEGFGRDFMLRAGMPIVEQQLTLRDGKIARLALTQRPAKPLSGNLPWVERTEVLLFYSDRPPMRIPVELRSRRTEVAAATGKPAPDFVFANARDYGYFLLLLDPASVHALENGALARVDDPFLRAMLWGALWDQVRNYRMLPERFVRLALRTLPRETDEQVVPFVLARLGRAVSAYLLPRARDSIHLDVERMLWDAAGDKSRPYGIRKAYVDAFIDLAASPDGIAKVDTLFSADSVAGEPLKDPTRWDIATRLLELGAPEAEARYAEQVKRDTTADGRRRAFIAAAGRPSAETKRTYFTRYFADASLNEDWASGSLSEFNALEHQALTFPYMRPALDSLPFIQAHRRIFYLETWLAAYMRGQTGDSALRVVRQYLADNPRLPLDLRRKVLQHADELERTVRIRRMASFAAPLRSFAPSPAVDSPARRST